MTSFVGHYLVILMHTDVPQNGSWEILEGRVLRNKINGVWGGMGMAVNLT